MLNLCSKASVRFSKLFVQYCSKRTASFYERSGNTYIGFVSFQDNHNKKLSLVRNSNNKSSLIRLYKNTMGFGNSSSST